MASEWLDEAVSGGTVSSDALIGKSEMLFGECLLDDEDGGAKCKELDAAMTALGQRVAERGAKPVKKQGFSINFAQDKVDVATDKLVKAAAKFGPDQVKAAKAWAAEAKSTGSADGSSLLRQEIVFFGECLLSEDGSPSKCQELEGAMEALREVMGRTDEPEPEPVAVAASGASSSGMGPSKSRNGCYPYK